MTEPGEHGGRAAALRIAGLAVLVVLAVVFARARAAGMTPPLHPPSQSATLMTIRILALAILATAVMLLVGSRRIRRVRVAGQRVKLKKSVGKPSRRVLIATLVGLLLAFGLQIFQGAREERKPPPPPPSAAQEENASRIGGQRPPPHGEPDSGIADSVVLVAAMLTLGLLIVVLVRRRSEFLEDEPADDEDEDEAMAQAVRAARVAVADKAITDPRAAIVACFAAMEYALADRGGAVTPQDCDTPSEVLYRGIESASLPESAALTLLRLFREARFSTHPMTERDRGDADDSLGELLRALGSAAYERSGGTR